MLYLGSHLMGSNGQIKEAMAFAEEGLRLFRELDHKLGISFGLNLLGEVARLDDDYLRAGQLYEKCLTLTIEMGDRQREAMSLGNLSYVAYHQGNYDRAIDYSKKALALYSSLQMEHGSAISLAMIAGPIGAKGDPKRAASLLAASETQYEAMGASVQPADKLEVDLFKNAVKEQLGESEFNRAWAEGRAMSHEEAVAYALEDD
jgi:tetratricopeptide (TPR) repeat protein